MPDITVDGAQVMTRAQLANREKTMTGCRVELSLGPNLSMLLRPKPPVGFEGHVVGSPNRRISMLHVARDTHDGL